MEAISMFCAQCSGETLVRGRLVVTRCMDGRWLLRLETGRRDSAWLELAPADAAWLAEVLAQHPQIDNHIAGAAAEPVGWH